MYMYMYTIFLLLLLLLVYAEQQQNAAECASLSSSFNETASLGAEVRGEGGREGGRGEEVEWKWWGVRSGGGRGGGEGCGVECMT